MAARVQESQLMNDWPVTVIPNPLDLDRFHPIEPSSARRQLGLPLDVPLLLYVADGGTGNPIKGFNEMVAALPRVSAEHPEVQLVLIGERTPQDLPRLLVPVHSLGQVDDDATMAVAYGVANCVVVPSVIDNLPQVATEAHACGRPVAAFRTGGLPDIVDHEVTGHLAEPGQPHSLAHAINVTLERDAGSGQLGLAARRRAELLWDSQHVAKQYANLYQQVASSKQAIRRRPGSDHPTG
jgi:glycosyltransferase involved in cell wall biosynthesis